MQRGTVQCRKLGKWLKHGRKSRQKRLDGQKWLFGLVAVKQCKRQERLYIVIINRHGTASRYKMSMKDYKKEVTAFADLLEEKSHGEGEEKRTWVCFKSEVISSDNPYYEKLSDVMRDMNFSQDFLYATVGTALDAMAELESYEEADEWSPGDFADSNVDVYTYDLTAWLHASNYHVYYLEEAVNELDAKDGFAILTGAQYLAILEIASAIQNMILDTKEA